MSNTAANGTDAPTIETSDAPVPSGPYAQGRYVGGLLFTAGFGPQDPQTGQIVGHDIRTQTAQALTNVEQVLAAAGLTLADVVKATVHLSDLAADFAGFNEEYSRRFTAPFPVRTTVGSTLPGFLVEIDVVAQLPAH